MNIQEFQKKKKLKQKISMITCYDYTFARIIDQSKVDSILIGDSAAMTMHGHRSTIHADIDMMALHTAAVARGCQTKLLIGDLPFLSYRKSLSENISAAEKLMKAGAHSLKLEGAEGNLDLVHHLVQSGIPIMGHLGLTPQSIHQLGGYKVQGRDQVAAIKIIDQAKALQDAGCFSIVLECVPSALAETITEELEIPVIGIGAGAKTDGQVLVLQDLLGLNLDFKPKFVRQYRHLSQDVLSAMNEFHQTISNEEFPKSEESYL